MHAHTHARTHAHTQPFHGSMDFVQNNTGEPVPEETFTNSHLPWSSIISYLLLPSNTIHSVLHAYTYSETLQNDVQCQSTKLAIMTLSKT